MKKILFIILSTNIMLSGCKSVKLPRMFNKGPQELPRYGLDATHYQCENAQSFGLKMSETGEDVWLMLPDHEINLARDSSDKTLYHYGTTDLHLNGDNTTLDDTDHLHYKGCKPVKQGK